MSFAEYHHFIGRNSSSCGIFGGTIVRCGLGGKWVEIEWQFDALHRAWEERCWGYGEVKWWGEKERREYLNSRTELKVLARRGPKTNASATVDNIMNSRTRARVILGEKGQRSLSVCGKRHYLSIVPLTCTCCEKGRWRKKKFQSTSHLRHPQVKSASWLSSLARCMWQQLSRKPSRIRTYHHVSLACCIAGCVRHNLPCFLPYRDQKILLNSMVTKSDTEWERMVLVSDDWSSHGDNKEGGTSSSSSSNTTSTCTWFENDGTGTWTVQCQENGTHLSWWRCRW